jgi:DNA-binding NtrC family response regulator
LMPLVRKGDFREDLYYRLNVFPIHVPPLRRRVEDVPLLIEHMLNNRGKSMSDAAVAKLMTYSFPGNIRELENMVESAACTASSNVIEADDIVLPEADRPLPLEHIIAGDFWESVARPYAERLITKNQMEHLIRQGLERTGGSYKKMLPLFRLPDSDYKRFMDFLRRHHCNIDFRGYRRK